MKAYICTECGLLYDDESADIGADGKILTFEQLNDEWKCPICGIQKELFGQTKSDRTHDLTNAER